MKNLQCLSNVLQRTVNKTKANRLFLCCSFHVPILKSRMLILILRLARRILLLKKTADSFQVNLFPDGNFLAIKWHIQVRKSHCGYLKIHFFDQKTDFHAKTKQCKCL